MWFYLLALLFTTSFTAAAAEKKPFVQSTPDAVTKKVLSANDPEQVFGEKYEGKWVKWTTKFERKGMVVEFVSSASDYTAVTCKKMAATHDAAAFAGVKAWQKIQIEGQMYAFTKQLGKNKFEILLKECVAKKL